MSNDDVEVPGAFGQKRSWGAWTGRSRSCTHSRAKADERVEKRSIGLEELCWTVLSALAIGVLLNKRTTVTDVWLQAVLGSGRFAYGYSTDVGKGLMTDKIMAAGGLTLEKQK